MESDPALVLSAAVESTVRSSLPPQIQDQLETQVFGTGDLLVACAVPVQGTRLGGGIQRLVRLNGVIYRAAVYGRRANQTTKFNVPLHGVALDGVLALDQDVLAELTLEEAASSSEPIVDVSTNVGPSLPSTQAVFARMGGTLYQFASTEHLRQSEALLQEAESGQTAKVSEPASALLEHARFRDGVLRAASRPGLAPASRVTDLKVLVIRTDFPDMQGDPQPMNGGPRYTAAAVQELADGQIARFYQQSSYGQATMHFTVSPRVYRLPATAAHYASTGYYYYALYNDALAAAGADYVVSNYDKVIVLFSYLGWLPNSQMQFGGLTQLGTSEVWVNGEFDFRVVAHELGHTFGLPHASFWQSHNSNPVSASGGSMEYWDPFDVMGYNWGNNARTDFNPWYKYQLNWIQDSQVQAIKQSGVYRVYRFDNAQATGTLALKVAKDDVRDCWIGYRRNFPENAGLQNGAYAIWGYHWPQQSNLLGLGPQLNNNKDPGLPVGGIVADPQANLTINVIAEGGTAPHEYLDVQIIFGPPPMVTRQPESQTVLEGQLAQFSVETSANTDYLWQRLDYASHEWVNLSESGGYAGTATPALRIAPVVLSMSGDVFRCLLTNAQGGFNASGSAVLTVKEFGVETLAGQAGERGRSNGIGNLARFSNPMGIAVDRSGGVYIADTGNNIIRKVSSTGSVSTLAGTAGVSGHIDGVGEAARFNAPVGIAVDSDGNSFVTDQFDSTIRKITPDGVVSTLAAAFSAQAGKAKMAPAAAFNHPSGIAVDCFGNLYIADTGSSTIRKMTADGVVSILAGLSGSVGTDDGQGASARFNNPFGIAVDLDGNVYVTDQGNSVVRKITADGTVTTIAGAAGNPGSGDGFGTVARFSYPAGLAADDAGNLYVADRTNLTIRKIDAAGRVSTIAGVAGTDGSADGSTDAALFSFPTGVAVDYSGVVYVVDTSANTVRMIRSTVPQPPTLRMKIVQGQLMLCWPSTATGFILESRSHFAADAPWTPVEATPKIHGCNFVVTPSLQTPAAFFRLQHQ